MSTCANCSQQCDSRNNCSQCDACSRSLHFSCVGITSEDHARITRNRSKCIKIYCNDCSAVDIRPLLLQLSKKIETLENKILNQTSLTETQLVIEKVAAEAVERITRAKNIIVHGVAELSGNPKEQQKQDENTAKELTIVLSGEESCLPVRAIRLGKTTTNKPRPLKIILTDASYTKTCLRNQKRLINSEFENLKITDDKTPHQLNNLKELRAEVARRTSEGEKDLTIKYIRGAATITKK